MKDLITVRLINALDTSYIARIDKQLKTEKRSSLHQLFRLIVKNGSANLIREDVFKTIFKKKWSKQEDYMLRNELRLLKSKIEEIVIAHSRQQDDKQLLLQFYKELKLVDEYETIVKELMDENETEYNYHKNLQLQLDSTIFIAAREPLFQKKVQKLESGLSALDENIAKTVSVWKARRNLLCAQFLLAKKQLTNEENKMIFDYVPYVVDLINYKNNYTDYLTDTATAYQNFDKSTVAEWERLYGLLMSVSDDKAQFLPEKIFTIGGLATVASFRGEFDKADTYYRILFSDYAEQVYEKNINLTFNYITNLNKLKKYNESLQLLQKLQDRVGENIHIHTQFRTQKIVALCYLNKKDELISFLNKDFGELQAHEKIFYRFFFCIYYIMNRHYEEAQNEINNLYRSKLMSEVDNYFGLVTDLFKTVTAVLFENNGFEKWNPKETAEVQKKLQSIAQSQKPILLTYTPYLWLKNQIEKNSTH